MIDLHTHTFLSDGVLIPSELVRRAIQKGYKAIAITDHADLSNIDFIIPRIVKVCQNLSLSWNMNVIPGIELTHVPPDTIKYLAQQARELGAKLVVVHGETIVEPVAEGTNMAAIEAMVDILAHPGLISIEEARLAKENSVYLEITSRKGHCLTNGHVARMGLNSGARLVINTDSHEPSDLITGEEALKVLIGSGLDSEASQDIFRNSLDLVTRAL